MKFKIEWHEECLKNSKTYLEAKEAVLNSLIREISILKESHDLYESQINTAIDKGLKSFDKDQFGITKSKAENKRVF